MTGLFGIDYHPWTGTNHCLRLTDEDGATCVNDHTGCLYNDGSNGCGFGRASQKSYDSPLRMKEQEPEDNNSK